MRFFLSEHKIVLGLLIHDSTSKQLEQQLGKSVLAKRMQAESFVRKALIL